MKWRKVRKKLSSDIFSQLMCIVEDIGSTHFGGVLRKKQKLSENEELVKVM